MEKEEKKLTDIERLEKKVDFLIHQVDRLNQTINPPVWKKILRWVWRHWFTLAMLLLVGFIAWNAWDAFQELQNKVSAIAELPTHAKESLWDAVEKVKFW